MSSAWKLIVETSTPGSSRPRLHRSRWLRLLATVVAASLAAPLTGCGIIPKDGPSRFDFAQTANVEVAPSAAPLDFALVALSPVTLAAANSAVVSSGPSFGAFAQTRGRSQARIATGDILSVAIFEASPGGLFIPQEAGSRSGNFVTVPNVQVDHSGTVAIPYAGSLNVVGKTPQEVGKEIAARLEKRAIEPQAVVTLIDRRSSEISVLGEVNLPQRFPLDPGGLTALEAIARAGGPKNPAYETLVTIQRGATHEHALMTSMVKFPRQNVQLKGGDVLYVSRESKIFMVLGATLPPGSVGGINNRRFPFDNDNETLAEALSKSGGLDDTRADAKSVFVYRFERRDTLREMGIDVSRYPADIVPTVYQVDLSRSDGFFLTKSFFMNNNDVIFVANAITPDLNKLLSSLALLTSSGYNTSIAAAQAR